jgi:hypothetical protein
MAIGRAARRSYLRLGGGFKNPFDTWRATFLAAGALAAIS